MRVVIHSFKLFLIHLIGIMFVTCAPSNKKENDTEAAELTVPKDTVIDELTQEQDALLFSLPASLSATNWSSDFYFYHNNYVFLNDTEGYVEYGQIARTTAIDPALDIDDNAILYENPREFTYLIIDSILQLTLETDPYEETFDFDPNYGTWVSQHEYAYGREHLVEGERVTHVNWE